MTLDSVRRLMSGLALTLVVASAARAGTWAKTYGEGAAVQAWAWQPTTDGGSVLGCILALPLSSGYIVKVDAEGRVEWQKSYSVTDEDYVSDIRQTSDGGYLVAGDVAGAGVVATDAWLMKLDASGGVEWSKRWDSGSDERARVARELSAGGYVVAIDGAGAWLCRVDATGTPMWETDFGSPFSSLTIADVHETAGGGLVFCGSLPDDVWVGAVDAAGTVLWQKSYALPNADRATALEPTSDGGWIVAAWAASGAWRDDEGWLIKLDSAGDVEWQKSYGTPDDDGFRSVVEVADGYLAAGFTARSGLGGAAWLVKLDASGNVTWQERYGGSGWDEGRGVGARPDGTLVLCGTTGSFDRVYEAWLLHLDSTGLIGRGCTLETPTTATAADTFATTVTAGPAAVAGSHVPVSAIPTVRNQTFATDEQCPDFSNCPPVTASIDSVLPGTTPCPGQTVTFTGSGTGEGALLLEWDFYYAGTFVADASGPTVSRSFPFPGGLTVALRVTDSCGIGQQAVASVDLSVQVPPTPTITESCAGADIILDVGAGWAARRWSTGATTRTINIGSDVTNPYSVTVTAANGCTGRAVRRATIDCSGSDVPGEVSHVLAGEPPLRVLSPHGPGLLVERETAATTYNVYCNDIGTWLPTGTGNVCHVASWTDNGNGTLTLDYDLRPGSWVVVTASSPTGEGSAGRWSDGTERMTVGPWITCGPSP